MKTCGTCFRCCENWRDAEAKGMKPVHYYGFAEYFHKPRPGVKLRALGVSCPDDNAIRRDHPACDSHEYRWVMNLKTWLKWRWRLPKRIAELYRKYIRVPFGGRRKAEPIEWKSCYDGMADKIIPRGEPTCPHCGDMVYDYEQCVFCGQRFFSYEPYPDKTAPQPPLKEGEAIFFADGICPECGCSCGNGGHGPLRCRCGWVGGGAMSEDLKKAIDELFAEEFAREG